MIGGKTPRQTDGLYCPLPKRFKGENRVRVAKIASGVLERATARSEAANAGKSGGAPAAKSTAPLPTFFPTKQEWKENLNENLATATRNLEEGIEITKKAKAQAQRYRGVFVFFGIVVVGILAVRFAALHWPHHATAPVNTPKIEMPHPAANRESTVSATPTPAAPPPTAPAPAAPTVATPIPAVSRTVMPPVTINPPEHKNGVAAEIDACDKFFDYCHARNDAELVRFNKLPDGSARESLAIEFNDLVRILQKNSDSIDKLVVRLKSGDLADEAKTRILTRMLAERTATTNAILEFERKLASTEHP